MYMQEISSEHSQKRGIVCYCCCGKTIDFKLLNQWNVPHRNGPFWPRLSMPILFPCIRTYIKLFLVLLIQGPVKMPFKHCNCIFLQQLLWQLVPVNYHSQCYKRVLQTYFNMRPTFTVLQSFGTSPAANKDTQMPVISSHPSLNILG